MSDTHNYRVVSIRFDLNNPDERQLFAWLKTQTGVSNTAKMGLSFLQRTLGDQDLSIPMGQKMADQFNKKPKSRHRRSPKKPESSHNQATPKESVNNDDKVSKNDQLTDASDTTNFGFNKDVTTDNSSQKAKANLQTKSQPLNSNDEVDESPFGGNSSSITPSANKSGKSTNDADGGNWRDKLL